MVIVLGEYAGLPLQNLIRPSFTFPRGEGGTPQA